MRDEIQVRLTESRRLFSDDKSFPIDKIESLSFQILNAFSTGHKLAFVGNGGSAAEAMHLAAEFTGKCVLPHAPLPALCLNESQSALTAIANDFGIDSMFSRPVEAHLSAGDILVALSTSGTSKNIIRAIDVAVSRGVYCHLWTGDILTPRSDVTYWTVPSKSTPRIQEIHLIWGHLVAELVELKLAGV